MEDTDSLIYYGLKSTCPIKRCGLEPMDDKKWESIEDAGILLCTQGQVDCLKYNTQYRKLLRLQQDLE